MKKLLILATLLAFSIGTVQAGEVQDKVKLDKKPQQCSQKQVKKPEFGKRLNLTEEQKAQAKTIHEKSFNKMKPIMEKIKNDREQLKALKDDTSDTAKTKKEALRKDLKDLHLQAKTIREENMKEFEAILTDDQKSELAKIKKEGRKNFDKKFRKHHKKPIRPIKK